MSLMRVSRLTEPKLRSTTRVIVVAALTTQAVVPESYGLTMTQSNSTLRNLVVAANSAVSFIESNGSWILTGFYPAALLQSASNGDVTLAAPAGGKLWLEPGSGGNLMAPALPTASTGLPSGAIWRNGNVLNIV